MEIEICLVPRAPFKDFLNTPARWSCLVCHRRAGKTVACIQKLIKAAAECDKPNGRYAYIAPTYAQAKDVAWSYLKQFLSEIPGIDIRESDLSVTLPNGARIKLYGSDNYDRLRGLYLDGAVVDEAGDHDPRAWPEVIRPALADRQGWAVFIGTPKGKNAFYRIFTNSLADEGWFTLVLKASESGLLADEELADAKKMLTPSQYAQEFECSFDAAIAGAYFADCIDTARADGRIGHVPHDPLMPVWAYWDIGSAGKTSDATAIWVAQLVGQAIRVVDYYEAQGQPLATHVNWLRSKGYDNAKVILPHDGVRSDAVHKVTYEGALREAGFPVRVVENQGTGAAKLRIEAARRLFPRIWFDERKAHGGIEALAHYHEKRDEKRDIGLGPDHDWSSHAADAFGLMCVAYKEPYQHFEAEAPAISIA